MSNEYGRQNDYARKDSRPAREGAASHTSRQAAWQKAPGATPEQQEADTLNGLLTNKLLSALPSEDFARLFPHLEPVSLSVGDVLYKLDEEMRYVYFPETAVVSHLYILNEGGMTEADMVGREGVVGLSSLFNAPAPAYVTEVALAGNALRARVDALRQEFARCGSFQQAILRYAGERIALLSRRAVCNGNHRVEERLCTWLLMMDDRAGGYPLTLTHERISRHLGTRRAGVTSAATVLRDRGIIDYTRGVIRITDREMMEGTACECYGSLKENFYAPVTPTH
jgi:CRP-like cAMP-binding protein